MLDLSQNEVAERIGVTRSAVSRLLRAAREQQIVQFRITHPLDRNAELEKRIGRRFGSALSEVRVAVGDRMSKQAPAPGRNGTPDDPSWQAGPLLGIASACTDWLNDHLVDGATIGLSWGHTVQAFVDGAAFDQHWSVHVVQLAGDAAMDQRHRGQDAVRDLAQKLGGRYTYFNVPGVAPTAEMAASLKSFPQVSELLELAQKVDIAILGVGQFRLGSTDFFLRHAAATDAELAQMTERGVVGQLCGRFFDDSGRQVDLDLDQRVLSVDIPDVARIPNVVVLAAGADKGRATRAAIEGGLADVLIIDEALAEALLTA